jgi:UDP-N-acetylglucosamine 2-epimerase (non-hydrolysing)
MTDVLLQVRDAVAGREPQLPEGIDPSRPYYVSTLHRAENTDDPQRLASIVESLAGVDAPVLLLAHPRLRHRASDFGVDLGQGRLVPADPLPYPELVRAAMSSAGVITDSGGLQKEAFLLRVPCTTVRTETEWTETVDLGWNALATDVAQLSALVQRPRPQDTAAAPYGDGHAAGRAVQAIAAGRLR